MLGILAVMTNTIPALLALVAPFAFCKGRTKVHLTYNQQCIGRMCRDVGFMHGPFCRKFGATLNAEFLLLPSDLVPSPVLSRVFLRECFLYLQSRRLTVFTTLIVD